MMKNVKNGNIKIVNEEYENIRRQSHDHFLGNEIIQNSLLQHRQLWEQG